MNLSGKVVAVTGGFGQLGAAIVHAALAAGAKVAAIGAGSSPADPRAFRDALVIGGVDLAEPDAATRALDTVAATLGGLSGLVNTAGTFRSQTLEHGNIETWDLLYRVNLRTAVSACHAALPLLLHAGGGRIVNVGAAAAAAKAGAGMGAYAAAKAGVLKLTESLAEELKDRGITVNAVLPSIIDTPANRADMPTADFTRWVTARDVANVIVFLLSDEARAVTGALIPVTGRV